MPAIVFLEKIYAGLLTLAVCVPCICLLYLFFCVCHCDLLVFYFVALHKLWGFIKGMLLGTCLIVVMIIFSVSNNKKLLFYAVSYWKYRYYILWKTVVW